MLALPDRDRYRTRKDVQQRDWGHSFSQWTVNDSTGHEYVLNLPHPGLRIYGTQNNPQMILQSLTVSVHVAARLCSASALLITHISVSVHLSARSLVVVSTEVPFPPLFSTQLTFKYD